MSEQELRKLLIENKINADSLKFLWEVDFEQVHGLIVSGEDAIAHWNSLRQLVNKIKHYPLLLGVEWEIDNHREAIDLHRQDVETYADSRDEDADSRDKDFATSTTEIIERGSCLDSDTWFQSRAQEMYEEWGEFRELDTEDPLEGLIQPILGEWRDDVLPAHTFTISYDTLNREPFSKVAIALIPTQICWRVPAYLRFGSWNDCPAPEVHVGIMKRWYERYGAEVVGISRDVVEMRVANPLLDRESALNLAKEQYLYCYNIMEQGTQTLSVLAATLLKSSAWYFWWD